VKNIKVTRRLGKYWLAVVIDNCVINLLLLALFFPNARCLSAKPPLIIIIFIVTTVKTPHPVTTVYLQLYLKARVIRGLRLYHLCS
jgi:hypothetical protein